MNWKYRIGATFGYCGHALLSRRWFPRWRAFPQGRSWLYDVQRFSPAPAFEFAFDVGANVGQTAVQIRRYFPSASIYCFEPVSAPFEILAARFRDARNVHCIRKALGRQEGHGRIELHRDPELNTLVRNQPRVDDLTGFVEEVEIVTLDAFCQAHRIAHLDILKLDVQGWEMEVLAGARAMIAAGAVRSVLCEVGFRPAMTDMQDFAALNAFMHDAGYMFCGLYDNFRYGENKEFVLFANALYTNPAFKPRDATPNQPRRPDGQS